MIALLILQASVTCVPLGTIVRCEERPQVSSQLPAVPNYSAPFAEQQKAQDKRTVTNMIANGNCVGAEQYALQRGDLDLAQQVKAYCSR